jgi:hypothetical protein
MRRGAAHPQKYTGCMEPPTRRPMRLSMFAGRESGDHSTNVLHVKREKSERKPAGDGPKLVFDSILGMRYIGLRV